MVRRTDEKSKKGHRNQSPEWKKTKKQANVLSFLLSKCIKNNLNLDNGLDLLLDEHGITDNNIAKNKSSNFFFSVLQKKKTYNIT